MNPIEIVDCSEAILGNIASLCVSPRHKPGLHACAHSDSATVNGIELPAHVVEELRLLGVPLGWYNAGELQDAVLACAYDGVLIDDPGGHNFRDRLSLTSSEKDRGQSNFAQKIREQRDKSSSAKPDKSRNQSAGTHETEEHHDFSSSIFSFPCWG